MRIFSNVFARMAMMMAAVFSQEARAMRRITTPGGDYRYIRSWKRRPRLISRRKINASHRRKAKAKAHHRRRRAGK